MCYYAATAPRPPNMITPPHTTAVMCRRHMYARNPQLRSDSDGRGLVHPNQRSACRRYAYSTNHAITQQTSSHSTTAHQRCNAPAACRRYAFARNPRLRSDSDGRGLRATTSGVRARGTRTAPTMPSHNKPHRAAPQHTSVAMRQPRAGA